MKSNKKAFVIAGLLTGLLALAQVDNDTKAKEKEIEEVVVTGQISPQSIKKSVKNVRVITAKDIKGLAATTLDDVLNQYINITVSPDVNTGRSTVSLFGLDGSYFKIFIDNIPLVNEGGVGNNTDLSQLNINDIGQIEIIEGSMGVTHGANAVSGILNIITKKKHKEKVGVNLSLQEESLGSEYNIKNKGRHIESMKVNYNIDDHWTFTAGFNKNKSSGYYAEYNGRDYQKSDGKRGYKFLPRDYMQHNALLGYQKGNLRAFYKFEYMSQEMDFVDKTAKSGYDGTRGIYKYGNDRRYLFTRNFHHLNINGTLWNTDYNISASYQYQDRVNDVFRYIINTKEELNSVETKDQSMEVLYSKGTFSKSFADKKYKFQLGYEVVANEGYALTDDAGHTTKETRKNINSYDIFAVSEISLTQNFALLPGFRYSFQTLFSNQNSYSLGLKYQLNSNYELRAATGKAYRTPDFYELYTYNVFDNHSFLGNENLIPENSWSSEASIKKISSLGGSAKLSNQILFSHSNINDKIFNALIDMDGNRPHYQYINISKYKNFHLSTTNQFKANQWTANLGVSLTWISQKVETEKYKTDDRYTLNLGANASVSYDIPRIDTKLSAYYKFVGKSQQWVVDGKGYVIGDINPYGWLDVSVQKSFLKNRLETTFGSRNILNTTDVTRTMTSLDGTVRKSTIAFGNGRSYFLKLTYNFKI